MKRIPLTWHTLGAEEAVSAAEVLASGKTLVDGEQLAAFEREFADFVGAKFAVATSSCTAALEACYLALGLKSGDEIVTTPLTFHATASAAIRAGATVRFADIVPGAWHLDPARTLRACSERTRAVVPVHLFGIPADILAFEKIVDGTGAVVIEDAAHAAGSRYRDGSRVGSRPNNLCCFSFNSQKPMSAGEGGMVTTGNEELASWIRTIVRQGMLRKCELRDQVFPGIKGAMGEVQAAIGRVQLRKLDGHNAERARLARLYAVRLDGLKGVEVGLPDLTQATMMPLLVIKRAAVAVGLLAESIESAVHYQPVHLLSEWRRRRGIGGRGSFVYAEERASYALSVPLFPGLEDSEVKHVVDVLARVACPTTHRSHETALPSAPLLAPPLASPEQPTT